jgi:2,3-bisphosphoglycerate-independent phosphoglycerate mutase
VPSFYEKFKITGSAISEVDLIKGIGICAGLDSVDVPGATGTLHTNYEGMAEAAVEEFKKGKDFVYLHIEAPDECSHQGSLEDKMLCLQFIDQRAIKLVVEYLKGSGEDFKVLIVPDHRTPLVLRTHSAEPVPFVIYDSKKQVTPDTDRAFTEKSGEKGSFFESGVALASYFFG